MWQKDEAPASYITSAEDLMLNLQLKQNMCTTEKATFDLTCLWGDAPWHGGGFQPVPHYEWEPGAEEQGKAKG